MTRHYDWIARPRQQVSRTAKLTELQAWMIRYGFSRKSDKALADLYRVGEHRVRAIRRGVGWRHITREWIINENQRGARGPES